MKLIQAARFLPVFSWLLQKIILIKIEYAIVTLTVNEIIITCLDT